MAKQQWVNHDELVHEFTKLTTDHDGLLGVLENTLTGASDDTLDQDVDASFQARRLLCILFQVQNYSYTACPKIFNGWKRLQTSPTDVRKTI